MLKKECPVRKEEAVEPHMVDDIKCIKIYVARTDTGKNRYEEVQVQEIDKNIYKLLSAPILALNLARNDIFEIVEENEPVKVLRRGGNFNIQIYDAKFTLEDFLDFKEELKNYLDGSIDSALGNNLAISISSEQGIHKINNFFTNFEKISGNGWAFSNIYKNYNNFDDDTLLNWWVK